MNILLIGGLDDEKFISKTQTLIDNPNIVNAYIFRSKNVIYSSNAKVKYLPFSKILLKRQSIMRRIVYDIYNLIGYTFLLFFRKIDVVIGIYLYPHGYYASILAMIFKKPFVLILTGTDLKMLIESRKSIRLFKQASFVGIRGNNSKKQLATLGFEVDKLFILPNFFDWEHNLINESNSAKNYDIVYIGYLRKLKRIDTMLIVIREIKKIYPNIQVLIAGDGDEKTNLIKLSKEYNLQDNVYFKPYTNPIDSILTSSKIFLLTSESEGLPMSIIEAMAFGLPIVTSNINDIPDVVEHGVNGYLVQPSDINSFVKYCISLLGDESLRHEMGIASRDKIKQLYKAEYSYDAVFKRWDVIIQYLKMNR